MSSVSDKFLFQNTRGLCELSWGRLCRGVPNSRPDYKYCICSKMYLYFTYIIVIEFNFFSSIWPSYRCRYFIFTKIWSFVGSIIIVSVLVQ